MTGGSTENQDLLNYDALARRLPWYSRQHVDARQENIDDRYRGLITPITSSLLGPNPTGLLLTGPVGAGKTYIIHAMAEALCRQVWSAMSHDPRMESRSAEDDKLAIFRGWVEMTFCVLTHYELVRAVRNWVDRGSVYYSRVWSRKELQQQAIEHPHLAPVVFVDDIGRGHDDQKGWNLTLLDEWFDWRWKQGLPTIITTNKSIEELNSWDGWERIIDRLADDSWVQTIIMNEESRRRT